MCKEEIDIIKNAWYQFGYYSEQKNMRWHGGLSTLEMIYSYLLKKGIINENGLVIGEEIKKEEGIKK